jgi:hypothetical protein
MSIATASTEAIRLQPPLRAFACYATCPWCRVIAFVTMMEDKKAGSRVKH